MFCPWQASLTCLLQVLSKEKLNKQFRDSLSQLCSHSDDAFLLLTSWKGERFAVIKESVKNLHPLLDVRGNISTKDEEKTEILNAFFTSVFYGQTSYPQGTQPPELEDRNEKQNAVLIIQGKTVTCCSTLMHTSLWVHMESTQEY